MLLLWCGGHLQEVDIVIAWLNLQTAWFDDMMLPSDAAWTSGGFFLFSVDSLIIHSFKHQRGSKFILFTNKNKRKGEWLKMRMFWKCWSDENAQVFSGSLNFCFLFAKCFLVCHNAVLLEVCVRQTNVNRYWWARVNPPDEYLQYKRVGRDGWLPQQRGHNIEEYHQLMDHQCLFVVDLFG